MTAACLTPLLALPLVASLASAADSPLLAHAAMHKGGKHATPPDATKTEEHGTTEAATGERDEAGEGLGDFDDDEVVEVSDLDDLEPGPDGTTGPPGGPAKVVGYFHAATVHLPIGWLLLLLAVDIATFLGKRPWAKAGWLLALLTTASFLPAVASGLARAESLPLPPSEMGDIVQHRNVMLATFVMVLIAVALRWRGGVEPSGALRHIYLGFIIVAAVLITWGGHLGGAMIYGGLPF